MRTENGRADNPASPGDGDAARRTRLPSVLVFAGALCLLFLPFLISLFRLAMNNDLYSHVPLVPVISAWLAWTRRERLSTLPPRRSPLPAYAPALLLAIAAIGVYGVCGCRTAGVTSDRLSLAILVFVTALLAGTAMLMGGHCMRAFLAPSLFLYFLVPMPGAVEYAFNATLQHLSAWTLGGLLQLTPVPVLQDGLTFHLPGFSLHVAEECSGIRSSLVLLITAILAGILFLRAPWRRLLLAASFLPIAALRNAIRILVLAIGTLYVDPDILKGPLHKSGGPLFFVLSLLPLFAIVLLLCRNERKQMSAAKDKRGETIT